MQVPAGFTTGLIIESAPAGKVAVGVANAGVLLGEFTMSPLDVANMAAAMLAASRDGASKLPAQEADASGALIAPTSFSLSPGSKPGDETLVMSFGASHLALSMPRDTMRDLGAKMVAIASRDS